MSKLSDLELHEVGLVGATSKLCQRMVEEIREYRRLAALATALNLPSEYLEPANEPETP